MELLAVEIKRLITLTLSPSEILRASSLNLHWYREVFSSDHWRKVYLPLRIELFLLPPLELAIPDLSLFCRLSIKSIGGLETMWRYPPKDCFLVRQPEGAVGPQGDIGTSCGPVGWVGPIGEMGNIGIIGEYFGSHGAVCKKKSFPTREHNNAKQKFSKLGGKKGRR